MAPDDRADVSLVVFLAKTLCLPTEVLPVGVSKRDGKQIYSPLLFSCEISDPTWAEPDYTTGVLPFFDDYRDRSCPKRWRALITSMEISLDMFAHLCVMFAKCLPENVGEVEVPRDEWTVLEEQADWLFRRLLYEDSAANLLLSYRGIADFLSMLFRPQIILRLASHEGLLQLTRRLGMDITVGYPQQFYIEFAANACVEELEAFVEECVKRGKNVPLRAQDICLGGDLDCIQYAHENGFPMNVDEQSFFVNLRQYLKWWREEPTIDGLEFFLTVGFSVKGKGHELLLAACRTGHRQFPRRSFLRAIVDADADFESRQIPPHEAFRYALDRISIVDPTPKM